MQQSDVMYRRVGRQEFLPALAAAKRERGDRGLCVSAPEEGADLYLSADGQSGYALSGRNFGSVFSLAKGRLAGMVRDAKARAWRNGFSRLNLDCFEPLATVYARHGWVETGRVAFDWRYAPEGWRDDMSEPDVVFMSMPTVSVRVAA